MSAKAESDRTKGRPERESGPEELPSPDRGVLALLDAGRNMPPGEAELYVRYVRALALLGECAPYVDEADYASLIGALLADAQANYPLAVRRHGERWEVAPLL